MNDTIKEYLVGLGFNVDSNSYNKFVSTLSKSDGLVEDFGITTVASFAQASVAVASFVVAATSGIAKFISEVAEADLEYQKFARQMWTSVDNAKAVKSSLDALNVTMEDLWLSPELLGQFRELRQETDKLRPPKEFTQQMKDIRSIQFEFAKARLELTYASQWVTYYLVKYLDRPLGQLKTMLDKANDAIVKYMPNWTEDIAQLLSWIVRLGIAGGRTVEVIVKGLMRIPNVVKAVLIALAAMSGIAMMNPFTWIVLSITALLLLMDDFFTYLDGGESAFGDFWAKVMSFGDKPMFKQLIESIDDVDESVGKIMDRLYKLGEVLGSTIGKDRMEKLQTGLSTFADFLTFVLNTVLQYTLVTLDGILLAIEGITEAIEGVTSTDVSGMRKNEGINALFNKGGLFAGGYTPMNGQQIVQSLYPNANPAAASTVNLTSAPVFNMYGTDPKIVSTNVLRQQESLLLRSVQGVKK